MSSPQGLTEVQSKIETWLEEEGFDFSQVKGKQALNSLFNYLVTLGSGDHLNVLQPRNKKDSICISTGLRFSGGQMKTLDQKTKVERREIFGEIRFRLASLDVEFSFQNGELPKIIRIDHPIYYDALSKDRFFKALSTVFKATQLTRWVIAQSI